MPYEAVIGLEVHAQLNTQSKIFSGASTAYGASPNSQVSVIDAALPGVLPVFNRVVLEKAIRFGLGANATVNTMSVFARKNYFYPDLPKGYQISQYEHPIVSGGFLDISTHSGQKRIHLTRAHLEEDAGKSLHEDFQGATGIDLNRAGTPLLEIVSEPELRSAKEAVAYLKQLHTLVRYLDICDGNMQEGSFRCDANVSVRPNGQEAFGTRVEIKNLNSFKFVEKAIDFEIERQIDLIESGRQVVQETRLYDVDQDQTRTMRSKEDAHDYRYFPDPDLMPVHISEAMIHATQNDMPELPAQKQHRFEHDYQLSPEEAGFLVDSRELADYFESVCKVSKNAKLAHSWITVELQGMLNKHNMTVTDSKISAEKLGLLLCRVNDKTLSGKLAKTVFETLWQEGGEVDAIIEQKGLKQVSDSSVLESMVDEIIAEFPEQVSQYLSGKDKVFGFFVGQAMKRSKGKANPAVINQLLKSKLKAEK